MRYKEPCQSKKARLSNEIELEIQKMEKEEHTLYRSTCLEQGKRLWVKAVGSDSKPLVWENAAYVARADRWCLLFYKSTCAIYMA